MKALLADVQFAWVGVVALAVIGAGLVVVMAERDRRNGKK
jgi:hypothetical protein